MGLAGVGSVARTAGNILPYIKKPAMPLYYQYIIFLRLSQTPEDMASESYPKIYLYKRMVDAKLFVDRCFMDNIDIDAVAAEACISKFHFIRLFRQMYGTTPHKYLTFLRMARAKELLQNGASISDTCYLLGFTSLSSFNKLFRQHLKVNPSVYSMQAKNRKNSIAATPLKHIPQSYVLYMGWDK